MSEIYIVRAQPLFYLLFDGGLLLVVVFFKLFKCTSDGVRYLAENEYT